MTNCQVRWISLTKRCNQIVLEVSSCTFPLFFSFSSIKLLLISLIHLAHLHCEAFSFPSPLYFPSYMAAFYGFHLDITSRGKILLTAHMHTEVPQSSAYSPSEHLRGNRTATSLGHSPNRECFKNRHHINFYTSLYLLYPVQQHPNCSTNIC